MDEEKLFTPVGRRRSRSKSEATSDLVVLHSRANLLQHVHHLEMALSARMSQLEEYVTTLESSFSRFLLPPTSRGSPLPQTNRLGELESDLRSLHKDVDAMEKMFNSQAHH